MDEYLKQVEAYRVAMSIAKSMLVRGIISDAEYEKIDAIMAKKHGLSLSSIYH